MPRQTDQHTHTRARAMKKKRKYYRIPETLCVDSTIMKYYKQLYSHKFNNLHEILIILLQIQMIKSHSRRSR